MKIVSIVSQLQYTKKQLNKLQPIGEFTNHSVSKIKGSEITKYIADAQILIVGSSGVDQIDAKVLQACPNLKFISVLGVGTDFIDLATASKLGIKVSNLKGANAQSVAEHTWGLIFNLSKQITKSHIDTQNGNTGFAPYQGIQLHGKTLGILGLGEIGQRIARIGQSLNMNIYAFNRSPKQIEGVSLTNLNQLLAESDVIAVCLPLTPETKNLLSYEQFKLIKNQAILVSPSREEILERKALLATLQDDKLFGFAQDLDINQPADKRLYQFKNIILTPHTAFFTKESEQKSNDMGVDNVVAFVTGKPQNLVN